LSSIFRFYIFIFASVAAFIFLLLQLYFVPIAAIFATWAIILILSRPFTKQALKQYYETIKTLQDVIENKKPSQEKTLPEFDNIIINLKALIDDSTETIEQVKHRQSAISKILDTAEDGFLLLDKDYKILMANKAGLAVFNIKRIRKRYTFIQLYRNERVTLALKKSRETPIVIDIEKDGETHRLHFNRAAGGYTIFTKNVSDVIRMEQLQREFSSNVSHALKTPLTSISGFAELMHKGMVVDKDKIADHSYKIYTEAQRLIVLIDDILRLAHLEGTPSVKAEQLQEVQDIVINALDMLSQKIKAKNLTVNITGKGRTPIKYSHMVELTANLLDNAVKYNKNGGRITITIEENDKLVLTVADTGIGIEQDKLPFIFERFYRVPGNTQGNGLGLSIVDTIVKLYKGKIEVTSVKGEGTTFKVILFKS